MDEYHWLLSFTFWQRIIKLGLLVWFALQTRLLFHIRVVFTGVWDLIVNRLFPSGQFFTSLSTLFESLVLFFLFYIIFIFWLAQFILPVTDWRDRWPAASRLFRFSIMGGRFHGPAVFVRDGDIKNISELQKKGPGVVFVDLRSAITLDTHQLRKGDLAPAALERPQKAHFDKKNKTYVSNVRVAGPGLVFTGKNEKVTGFVDLRNQVRSEKGVQADTRDGIRIKTDVSCTFTLGEPPDILDVCLGGEKGKQVFVIEWDHSLPLSHKRIKTLSRDLDEGDEQEILNFVKSHPDPATVSADIHNSGYPYTFDEKRVERAIYFQNLASDPKTSHDLHFRKWSDLPQHVAAEKFRILLAKWPYLKLYTTEDPKSFLLKDLRKELTRQVRNTGVLGYRVIALREGGYLEAERLYSTSELVYYPSRNLLRFDVLRDRGIKVISAGFGDLEPVDPSVREHLIDSWRSAKQKEADLKVADSSLEIARIKNQARVRAQQNLIYHLTQVLENQEYPREALAMLIYQELEAAAANPETRKLLPADTLSLLTGIGTILLPAEKNAAQQGMGVPLISKDEDNP